MWVSGKVLSISDDSEDPRFYARDVPEDSRDEQGKDEEVERFPESMRLIEEAIVGAISEQFIETARAQAASVTNPVTREQLRACLDAAERIYGERNL